MIDFLKGGYNILTFGYICRQLYAELSVSQIAYELGFEHSQSFSKLFKTKTKLSPMEFRASFH
ncbi:MAG: helix-turn-helix domain-containing protein [Sphingobacterium sp.]